MTAEKEKAPRGGCLGAKAQLGSQWLLYISPTANPQGPSGQVQSVRYGASFKFLMQYYYSIDTELPEGLI